MRFFSKSFEILKISLNKLIEKLKQKQKTLNDHTASAKIEGLEKRRIIKIENETVCLDFGIPDEIRDEIPEANKCFLKHRGREVTLGEIQAFLHICNGFKLGKSYIVLILEELKNDGKIQAIFHRKSG